MALPFAVCSAALTLAVNIGWEVLEEDLEPEPEFSCYFRTRLGMYWAGILLFGILAVAKTHCWPCAIGTLVSGIFLLPVITVHLVGRALSCYKL